MSEKKYNAIPGAPFKKEDVQAIGEFIENAPDKSTTGLLRHIREHTDHVIHSYIEWDDKVAAQKHRLQQVRGIVEHISIEIEDVGASVPLRAYFSVKDEDNKRPHYEPVDVTFSRKDYREQVIERAKRELKNWAERYRAYNELQPFVRAIRGLLKEDEEEEET